MPVTFRTLISTSYSSKQKKKKMESKIKFDFFNLNYLTLNKQDIINVYFYYSTKL